MTRYEFLKAVLWRHRIQLIAAVGLYDLLVGQVLPASLESDLPRLNDVLGWLGAWGTLIAALVFLFLAGLEGSYRLIQSAEKQHNLALLTVEAERDAYKGKLNERAERRMIRERLGELLSEGQEIQSKCGEERNAPPDSEAAAWDQRVRSFLDESLGTDYSARFQSSAGLPLTANSISSVPHRNLWGALHTRLARLQEFLAELSSPVP